jgi:hypothetical protein
MCVADERLVDLTQLELNASCYAAWRQETVYVALINIKRSHAQVQVIARLNLRYAALHGLTHKKEKT